MRRTIGALLTIAALALTAACSDGGEQLVAGSGDPTTGGDEPGEGPPATVGVPGGGPDGLVVEVAVGGGFMPIGHDFRTVPSPVVYEDGTTLSTGPMIMIYPGPAVVPVVSGQIDEAEVQALVDAAAEAGLLDDGDPDVGEPPVADAATTTVTVVVDGVEHVTSVYALGIGGGGPEGGDDPLPGITPEQAEQRQRIADFVARVSEVTAVTDAEPWEPDRYRVMPLPSSAEPPAEEGIEPEERDWPVPEVPLTEGECSAVTGEAADALREALADANELTRWRTASGTHLLAIRPVLPHEPDCPA